MTSQEIKTVILSHTDDRIYNEVRAMLENKTLAEDSLLCLAEECQNLSTANNRQLKLIDFSYDEEHNGLSLSFGYSFSFLGK